MAGKLHIMKVSFCFIVWVAHLLQIKHFLNISGDLQIESVIAADWFESAISVSTILIPKEFNLSPAYPNPFNPTTTLEFAIPVDSEVFLSVYNLQGRELL